MKSFRVRFATECRLTCWGGSERGTCECQGPAECRLRNAPGFKPARAEAARRMARHATNPGIFEATAKVDIQPGQFVTVDQVVKHRWPPSAQTRAIDSIAEMIRHRGQEPVEDSPDGSE